MTGTDLRLRQPGLAWRSEMEEAAYNHGYRRPCGEADGWFFYRNEEGVPGEIALAVGPDADGAPWFLAIDHPGVAAELDAPPAHPGPTGRFAATYAFPSRAALRDAIGRSYRLAASVPDHPLREYQRATAHLGDTEADRIVRQRIGQDRFRAALMDYWSGACPLTGIAEPALLRASHIVPWAECRSDFQRLDVHNGLLLAAHWDAAFDGGLLSFADTGEVLLGPRLDGAAKMLFGVAPVLVGLTDRHRENLAEHRQRNGF